MLKPGNLTVRRGWLGACLIALLACGSGVGHGAGETTAAQEEGSYPAPGSIRLTEAERQWLHDHPTIWLGVDPNYPPFDFIGKDGNHQGIAADYIRLITDKLGLRYEVASARSSQELLQNFKRGQLDMLAAVSKAPSREQFMLLSEPYMTIPWAIVTPIDAPYVHSLSDLKKKTVAIVGIRSVHEKIQSDYPQIRIREAKDVGEALDMVDRGEAAASISNLAVASELIELRYEGRLKIASTVQGAMHELRFGVREDWPELVSLLNKGLASITEEEHRAIRAKWLTVRYEGVVNWRRVLWVVIPIGAALLLVIGVVSVSNRRLREEIGQRHQAERALKDNEERLSAILRSAPEGVATIDNHGTITYWNPQAERIFGYRADEALGREVHSLLAPVRYLADAGANMARFAATGEGRVIDQVVEIEGRHKDGHEVSIDIARAAYRQSNAWHAVAFFRDVGARKEAEAALKQATSLAQASRTRLLAMSDALPCAVYQVQVDHDGTRRYTFVSKKVADILGVDLYTLREDSEARWRNVVEPDRQRVHAMVEEAARRHAPLFCEYRVKLGAKCRWVRQEALPQEQPDGTWVWNGYWLDVTDIKQAEAKVSNQLIFQQLLLDSLPNPVYFKGPDGRFLGCNRACEEAFGLKREDIIGKTALEVEQFPARLRRRYHEGDLELIRECASRHMQTRIRFGDGQDHDVLFSATGFRLSDGSPGGLIGVVVDISEQKRAERRLRDTETWYRSILEVAPDGMLVVDTDGRITLANAQIEELFGYSCEELVGQPVELLVPQRFRARHPAHRKHYLHSAEMRAMGSGLELYARRKDGSEFPVEIGLSPLPRQEGQRTSVCATVRDITERKKAADVLHRAKEQAEQATQAKSMFLANMSHEIRTPLNAIIGMAHLALRTGLTPKQRDYLAKIQGAGASLLGVINDILDFSKIEAGKLGMERIEFSLEDVLGSLVPVAGHRAAEKGIEFLVHAAADVPRGLVGDPLRLGQVLNNLVSNAVKFTEQGEIEVSVHTVERGKDFVKLQFAVRDTGIGMEPEQAGRLFQPFTQADGSTTRKYGGTGLGLTISKRLVDLMDGEIRVDSQPGRGSIFLFTARFGLGQQQAPARPIAEALRGMRLLVADDNAAVRDVLVEMLEQLPVRVEAVDSGAAAVRAVREADRGDPFGVVLMDWKMPTLDGIDAARQIKRDPGLRTPPAVIMVTAFGHDEFRQEAEAAGVDGFVVKPVTQSVLCDAVLAALAPRERQRAPVAAQQQRDYGLQGIRVLLVEDNEINRQIAGELLASVGAQVEMASGGAEAVAKVLGAARAPAFDAVLMDLQMPGMDGFEATKAIRAQVRHSALPIIAMTAHAMVEERERCLSAGMNDHIAKPIDPDILFETLGRWCRREPVRAPPVPAQSPAGLAQVPGLDAIGGLRRVAGNAELYLDLLRLFREGQADAPLRIRRALVVGDRGAAMGAAHTLRGVAGNLGADEVRDTAGALERALQAGAGGDAVEKSLRHLEQALSPLMSGLCDALPEPVQEAALAAADADSSQVAAVMKRLAGYLADGDGEAVDYLAANRALLRNAFPPSELARFEKAVRSFDFEAALEQLTALAGAAAIAL